LVTIESGRLFAGGGRGGMRGRDNRSRARDDRSGSGGARGHGTTSGYGHRLLPRQRVHPWRYCCIGGVNAWYHVATLGAGCYALACLGASSNGTPNVNASPILNAGEAGIGAGLSRVHASTEKRRFSSAAGTAPHECADRQRAAALASPQREKL